ncbi:hypothetical protein GFS31_16910 [Leptolyngbya sp. BL0902]|uniref:SH3 domain-containing protein n=1 Tax=Leptolyngbya sp. BL0902 TaxID=1115757 RepID=UPI0018E887FE|nr:SH3 domain-containing protein [Leptolyngbya sp. BL0902]QQE65006.1 hypothetical protein GFS31_16910 [Leptolyngbya sp. BL0902]
MLWPLGGNAPWLRVGLVGLLLVAGCSSSDTIATEASTPTDAPPEPAAAPTLEETIAGFRAAVIDPPRVTTLSGQTPGAKINLRSQPTTLSPIVGSGTAGDEVRLLRLAEGEGGYSWYYAQSPAADQEGWVRGDFVDISNATPVTATPSTAPSAAQNALATASPPCGSDRQEALFETQSYTVHLCQSAQGLRYVGTNRATQESVIIDDVAVNQSVYIAIDGNQQYHISDTHLARYEVHDGSYRPLQSEPVTRFERFLY